MLRARLHNILILLALSACKTEDGASELDRAPLGIHIPAKGDRPALRIALLVDPPVPDERALAGEMSSLLVRSMKTCGPSDTYDLAVTMTSEHRRLFDPRPHSDAPFETCMYEALTTTVTGLGVLRRQVMLQLRAVP